ncbi:transmembrane protein 154 isoform X2 [Cynoglossus semilaevis]|uniref:transmembrane protein 154 isoform X2 n=1 Tax=Cynoglossus semilaevis TaxID=244447 RepID=UPI00049852C4|nr:transmembrane protein 154 isoform X2 [Cynoglossus semilaevis]
MSASQSGNMRGLWLKSPLLLLLLLITVTGTVLSQPETEANEEEVEKESTDDPDPTEYKPDISEPLSTTVSDTTLAPELPASEEPVIRGSGEEGSGVFGSGETSTSETATPEEEELNLTFIIIPAVVGLVVIAIVSIVLGLFLRRWLNQKHRGEDLKINDPYLDESGAEKVPMPMFEEDVPSVLELEMEELDQWMKKDGETADTSSHG